MSKPSCRTDFFFVIKFCILVSYLICYFSTALCDVILKTCCEHSLLRHVEIAFGLSLQKKINELAELYINCSWQILKCCFGLSVHYFCDCQFVVLEMWCVVGKLYNVTQLGHEWLLMCHLYYSNFFFFFFKYPSSLEPFEVNLVVQPRANVLLQSPYLFLARQ